MSKVDLVVNVIGLTEYGFTSGELADEELDPTK